MAEPKSELQLKPSIKANRQELNAYQRALDMQWLNNRMEDSRMGQCLALIQREAEMEKDFQEKTDHEAIVNARADREAKLAMEIAKVQQEEVCQLLRRHYLRERDPSLKLLAKKLQAGYVCRDLQQQILHNEYKKLQEKAEEVRAYKVLHNALSSNLEAEAQEEKAKMEQAVQYCKDLQQQLVNKQLQKQCQYEDSLIEKKMLEDIVRTISDEDMKELKQKREQTDKMRHEMKTFQQAREAWKKKHKEMLIIEERKIEEQNLMMTDRNLAIVAERNRRMRIKDELNEKMTAKILADEAARQERTNIINLLNEQEYLEKNYQNDIAESLKTERVRRESIDAIAENIEKRKKAEQIRKNIEAEFRRETEEKVALDMAKEHEKQQKKKEKGKLYAQELLQQIQDNARRRKLEKENEDNRAVYVNEYHNKWRAEVAEERKQMVAEHAPQLLGYLQAAVLRAADLAAVRAGAARDPRLAALDIEALAHSSRPQRFPKCNAECRVLREY